jgi:hypothetical protein
MVHLLMQPRGQVFTISFFAAETASNGQTLLAAKNEILKT